MSLSREPCKRNQEFIRKPFCDIWIDHIIIPSVSHCNLMISKVFRIKQLKQVILKQVIVKGFSMYCDYDPCGMIGDPLNAGYYVAITFLDIEFLPSVLCSAYGAGKSSILISYAKYLEAKKDGKKFIHI